MIAPNPTAEAPAEAQAVTAGGAAGPAAHPRRWPLPRGPAMLAAAYALFGLLWVLLSDRLLQRAAPDVATLAAVGQAKGMAFILVSSGLLYLAAARQHGPVAAAAPPLTATADERDALPWVLGLLAAAIVLASLIGYAHVAHRAHEQQLAELRRQAALKAGIVQAWVEERRAAAGRLADDPLLREAYRQWRRHPDTAATARLTQALAMLRAAGGLAGVLLVDGQARPLLAPDGAGRAVPAALAEAARHAAARPGVSSTDFYAQGREAGLGLDLLVPLDEEDGRRGALLVLRQAPDALLTRLLGPEGGARTLLRQSTPAGVLAVGADGTGRDEDDGAQIAVAAAVPQSAWHVAVQAPRERLYGTAWTGAATLALIDALALLAAGAALHASRQRRELRAAARLAADRLDQARGWKIAEAIANCSGDAIYAKDLDGRYLFVNREMCRALGLPREALIGASPADLLPPGPLRQLATDDSAALHADRPVCVETRLATPQGERIHACTKGRLVDDEGRTLGLYAVCSDVTERRDLQQRMRQWATAFEDVRDGVIITDALGRIRSVNRAFTAITGYSAKESVGASLRLLKSGRHDADFYRQMWATLNQQGHWQGEIWNRRKGGEVYPEWLTISAVRDDEAAVTHYVGVFTDISRLKHSEAQADWLTHHDPLTHLPNRLQLQRRLEEALARSHRHETRAVLMVIDLDGFKTVNDSLGHPAGDELLVCVARRLQARLRQEDFLGRLGGDEFLVILETGPDGGRVDALARDLLAAVSAPVALSCGRDAYLTASIGIRMFPDEGSSTAVELLRDADAAMYRAKELGRNRFCFYSGDLNASAMAKLELEAALSRAIERDELRLHYQPKVDARSGAVVGAEALLRWHRHGSGLVPPGDFIPLAEHSSLILAIGAWVVDAACRQLRQWMDAGLPVVRVAVNVAARQFAAGDLDVVVARALERHGVPADGLELELTEGMLISNPASGTQMLQRLRALGVKIALDDFGTGYSSLAYLQQLPIDALKIDQSFVRRIGEVPDGEALVDAIIGLAHRLRLRVVAEGVETAAQRRHLLGQGCDELQGYHFGRPVPAAAFEALLAAQAESAPA